MRAPLRPSPSLRRRPSLVAAPAVASALALLAPRSASAQAPAPAVAPTGTEPAADPLRAALAGYCAHDPRLAGAATLARDSRPRLDAELLTARAWRAGLAAPTVRAWVARGEPAALAVAARRWLAGQHVREGFARCAFSDEARDERGPVRALALVPRALELRLAGGDARPAGEGLLVSVAPDEALEVRADARGDEAGPRWFVAGPAGRASEAGEGSVARLRLHTPGLHRVQLVLATTEGPLPFAGFGVLVRARDDEGSLAASDALGRYGAAVADAAHAESEALALAEPRDVYRALARARRAAGRPALRRDPTLESLAAERAEQLAARGAVAHRLARDGGDDALSLARVAPRARGDGGEPSDGSGNDDNAAAMDEPERAAPGHEEAPEERLRRASVVADRVAENVSRAGTLGEAFERLGRSPGHRAVREEPSLDAVGVGVARRGSAVYLVELYARQPRLGGL